MVKFRIFSVFILTLLVASVSFAQDAVVKPAAVPDKVDEMTARELISKSDELTRGDSSYSEIVMIVHNEEWAQPERIMEMKAWERRVEETFFIRITGPTSRVRGVAFLKRESNLWQYQPRSERVTKVHPSLMLQSWMGSDFSNDDLVNESSVVDDYTHKIIAVGEAEGHPTVTIELTPKPDAAVVWGKIIYTMRTDDFVPLSNDFYDEDDVMVKKLEFGDIKQMGGRTIPALLMMKDLEDEGSWTRLEYKVMQFDISIPDRVFTQSNLKSKDF